MTQGRWGQVDRGQALPGSRCQHQQASRQEPREPPQRAAGGPGKASPWGDPHTARRRQAKMCESLPLTDGAITA